MMTLNTFKLEEYLSQHEFKAPYLLCCSDAESYTLQQILEYASDKEREDWNNLTLGYSECKGLPALCETIADSFYRPLGGEHISCFAGAQDAIFCTFFALCEPGDHVIVLTPCYQSLIEIPKLKGSDITTVELKEENNWRIDLNAIKKAIRPNTKWLIMNFPHNPTGQIITDDEWVELVRLLDQHNIWIFSDEVYRLLGVTKDWSKPAVCVYDKAISLGVMSKAFGLAGLRIGWLACRNKKILEKIEKVRHYTSICNSALSEFVSLIALRNKDAILLRNNRIVQKNISLLDQFFEQHQENFKWVRPEGGCVGFVKYLSSESVDDFTKRLVESTGVLLMPGSIYDVNTNHFRIGFGRKNMPEALNILKDFLK